MSKNRYSFRLAWNDEDSVYIATCPEFPGLMAHGETPEEALTEAGVALQGVIETYLEDGDPLPEPQTCQQFSGQFRVRMPKTLHRQASELAELENVSLNTFVVAALSEKIGAMRGKWFLSGTASNEFIRTYNPNVSRRVTTFPTKLLAVSTNNACILVFDAPNKSPEMTNASGTFEGTFLLAADSADNTPLPRRAIWLKRP